MKPDLQTPNADALARIAKRLPTTGEAIRTPGTKLHAASVAQRERNRTVDALTPEERRAYYLRVCR